MCALAITRRVTALDVVAFAADEYYHSPVKSETAAYPGKLILKMGMFPRIPKPEAQGFGLHRQSWEGKHEDIPVFEVKWAGPEKKQMAE